MMKPSVLHITPQFEPSRCGVSDYILAWQAEMGHSVDTTIAALCDRFINGVTQSQGLLRIGSDEGIPMRLQLLQQLLANHRFHFIVFHYVPLGYHAKGLPFWLTKITPILKGYGVPVTFILHEIWAGGKGKPFLLRIKGMLQRQFLTGWLHAFKDPVLLSTSAYTARLIAKEGLAVTWSPVFNNLGQQAQSIGLPTKVLQTCASGKYAVAILFGSMPPDAAPYEVAGFLKEVQNSKGKPLQIFHIGHGNVNAYLDALTAACMGLSINIEKLGPLPSEAINYLMRQSDWGISTYPYELWSKSGSIAAMLANGLPVMVMGKLKGITAGILPPLPPGLYAWQLLSAQERDQIFEKQGDKRHYFNYNERINAGLHALTNVGQSAAASPEPVSVVFTVYRCWPQALKAIDCVLLQAKAGNITEIILVHDDPGADVPISLLQNHLVRLEHNLKNIGYVASVNKGISLAENEYVLLLDADAFLQDSILPLKRLLDVNKHTTILAPSCLHPDGATVRRLYPVPGIASLFLGQKGEAGLGRVKKAAAVVAHSYAWMLRKSRFVQLGGLDNALHFLEADVEFCMRVEKYFPGGLQQCQATRVVHEGGANPIHRNKRVLEWYRSRWYILSKHGMIKHPRMLKGIIRMRLQAEKGVSGILAMLLPEKAGHWQQKRVGRQALLLDLKQWAEAPKDQ